LEKSLAAAVRTDRYDEPGRTFRYAHLSSGLDIVRKALGQHAPMITGEMQRVGKAELGGGIPDVPKARERKDRSKIDGLRKVS
jgi:hypothetical protein